MKTNSSATTLSERSKSEALRDWNYARTHAFADVPKGPNWERDMVGRPMPGAFVRKIVAKAMDQQTCPVNVIEDGNGKRFIEIEWPESVWFFIPYLPEKEGLPPAQPYASPDSPAVQAHLARMTARLEYLSMRPEEIATLK